MGLNQVIVQQPRLRAGPFWLVLRPDQLWALPGGGRARYGEIVLLARANSWLRPELVQVSVRYRSEAEGDF